ncbi:hypothetical protein JNN96_36190 [Mycobacterium sp. DSM 3803]|nr:hypothetical protein [Mycobacterium sp. DSM 3803]
MRAIPQDGPARLMFFIQRRLVQLGWSRDDLSAHGGPSPSTLYKTHRTNRAMNERSLHRLETALGWDEGSAERILAGGEPLMAISEQVETVKTRIDAAVAQSEDIAVGQLAAELHEFLLDVAQRLRAFYPDHEPPRKEVADAGSR